MHRKTYCTICVCVCFLDSKDDGDDKEVTSPADKGGEGGGGGGSSGDSSDDEQGGTISKCVCLFVCLSVCLSFRLSIIHELPFVIVIYMYNVCHFLLHIHFIDISPQSACPSCDMFLVVEETVTGYMLYIYHTTTVSPDCRVTIMFFVISLRV